MKPVSKQRAAWLGQRIFPHEAELRVWLSRRTLSGIEVDDVVQETYAILAGMESTDHIRDPRTYMFEVAKSVVLLALRRSRIITIDAVAEAEALQIPANEPGPETIAADRQELGRVAALIAGLPARCREVFILRKVQGLSQRQVAERLGLSESTIEKHLIKALGILTKAVGRSGNHRLGSSTDHDKVDAACFERSAGERRRH